MRVMPRGAVGGIVVAMAENPLTGPLLPRDVIVGFALANHVRHLVIERVFGVSRENSNLMTVIALGSAAVGVQHAVSRVTLRGPSAVDAGIGAVLLKEATHRVAGDWSRTTPLFGAFLTLALLDRSFGPMVRASVHGVRRSLHAGHSGVRAVRSVLNGQ
jgi:hypothetical protein